MFNQVKPSIMHVDINSCFATIEQQANPLLRGKPVVVAAYVENHGCILAASIEAKKLGLKTGMRVGEAKRVYTDLIVLAPDPEKYRFVNRKLLTLLLSYTPYVSVESIDEMVLRIMDRRREIVDVAKEIKQRIKIEIGEWMTVSIGIAPNRYLAKVASSIQKPDGLVRITKENIEAVLSSLKLEDLCGIKEGNAARLRASGVTTPLAMFASSPKTLQLAFRSIVGYYWWMRLHGYEDGAMYKSFDAPPENQKSFGQSYALGKPRTPDDPRLWQILSQLVMKMGRRLRKDGFTARGVGVFTLFADHSHWGLQHKIETPLFADADFYERARALLRKSPLKPIRILTISCFQLTKDLYSQQYLFTEENRKQILTQTIDAVQDRFGEFVITSGRMLAMEQKVLDRIAFGRIHELTR